MRKITSEEFFDMVDIWYDEVDNTLTMTYEGNMAWVINGNIAYSSNESVLFFSNHAENKKIFMNTGTYSLQHSMTENLEMVEEDYKASMKEFNDRLEKMQHECIDVHLN